MTTAIDHTEAMRLARQSLHIPVGTLLLSILLGTGAFSAVSMMWAW